jgi:hypothetical protein
MSTATPDAAPSFSCHGALPHAHCCTLARPAGETQARLWAAVAWEELCGCWTVTLMPGGCSGLSCTRQWPGSGLQRSTDPSPARPLTDCLPCCRTTPRNNIRWRRRSGWLATWAYTQGLTHERPQRDGCRVRAGSSMQGVVYTVASTLMQEEVPALMGVFWKVGV